MGTGGAEIGNQNTPVGSSLLETFSTGRSSGGAGPRAKSATRWIPPRALVVVATVLLLVVLDSALNAGEIRRGVRVGTVELGGKTLPQARQALEDEAVGLLEGVEVYGPRGVSFTAREMGVRVDAVATAERAYAIGRESVLWGFGDRLDALLGGTPVAPEVGYDPREVREELETLAAPLQEVKAREAEVRVTGGGVEVSEAREGRTVDITATVANVVAAIEAGRGEAEVVVREEEPAISTAEARGAGEVAEKALAGPVTFASGDDEWVVSPAELGEAVRVSPEGGRPRVSFDPDELRNVVEGAYAALTVEPVEAGFVVEDGEVSVREGRAGRRVEEGRLLAALEDGLLKGEGGVRRFELPVVTAQPELTAEEASDARPTTLLGRYRTDYTTYDDGPGRVANLEIASRAVDETVLAPGEIFSFNELAEPLDYYATSVIVNGQVDTADGGGLCQVASTLYMAANYAGLEVVERHPHYAELPYIRPGFDATVWFGDLDMRFENNTGSHLLLREWVDAEGYVNAEIWGRPSGKKVEMNSQLVSTSLDYEGNPVTEWVTYKRVERNGKVVYDGVVHRDTYGYLKP